MSHRCARLLIVACLVFAIAACTTPIRRVDSPNYGWGPRPEVTLAQIQAEIEKTARGQGWQLSEVKTGSFVAKREWGDKGKHNIVVDVVYDRKGFSIRYKDSKQMDYDGKNIHRTYNDMVETLRDGIKASVSPL